MATQSQKPDSEDILEALLRTTPASTLAAALRSVCGRDYEIKSRVIADLTADVSRQRKWHRSEADLGQALRRCKGCRKQYKDQDNVDSVCDFYTWHPGT